MSTGENWHVIMFDTAHALGTLFTAYYFIAFYTF